MSCWGKCQDHISTWTIRSTKHRRLFLFLNAKHETSFQAVGFVFKRVGIKLFRISIDFEHWTGVDISLNIADFIHSCKVTNISMVIYKTVSRNGGCYDLIIRWWRYVQVQVLLFVDVIFFLYEYLSIINVLHRSGRKSNLGCDQFLSSHHLKNWHSLQTMGESWWLDGYIMATTDDRRIENNVRFDHHLVKAVAFILCWTKIFGYFYLVNLMYLVRAHC